MPTVFDYGDLHDLGESAFRSIQEKALRNERARLRAAAASRWRPAESSLTRQAWAYQQHLMDLMGEVPDMGDVTTEAQARLERARQSAGVDDSVVATCGKAALISAFAGFVAGKVGLAKTLLGVGAVYLASEWIGSKK
jgi:hypothetical protein